MEKQTRPLARSLVRTKPAQTGWVVGALLTSLALAAASNASVGARAGAWSVGSLVVLAGAAGCLAFALRRRRTKPGTD